MKKKIYVTFQEEMEPDKYIFGVAEASQETELVSFFKTYIRAQFFMTYDEAWKEAQKWLNLMPENKLYSYIDA